LALRERKAIKVYKELMVLKVLKDFKVSKETLEIQAQQAKVLMKFGET
jgi:hypothetical protein